jgi:N-acylneuraminate cytidylyltransferase
MNNTNKIKKKCRSVRLIISDVDGVLTDGGMYYNENGEVMKKFNTKDGMGVEISRKKIKVVLMTKEKSRIVLKRAKKMKVEKVYIGIEKKEDLLPEICMTYKISKEEIAYIGDDVNDFNIMKQVGFSIAPNDGNKSIKQISDYICETNGGQGVLREVIDLILLNKNFKNSKLRNEGK